MVPATEVHDIALIDVEMRKKILRVGYSDLNALPHRGVSPLEAVAILKFELEMMTHRCAEEGVPSQAIQSARLAGQAMSEAECVQYASEGQPVN